MASVALMVGLVAGVVEAHSEAGSLGGPADSTAARDSSAHSSFEPAAGDSSPDSLQGERSPAPAFSVPFADPAPVAPARRGMTDTVTAIPGITVEGTRKQLERSTTAHTRLNRATLGRFLPSTTGDAMVSAPGVDLIKTGPWATKVSFRGLQGERVLVLVDDVRLNTGRGHGSNASLVSVDRLDQVELVPGSGGAEFGSDAVGGVVQLITHRPLFAPNRSLKLTLTARGTEPGDEYAQSARLKLASKFVGAEIHGGLGRLGALVTPEGRVENSGSRDEELGARLGVRLGEGALEFEHTRHTARDVGLPALSGEYPLIARDANRAEFAMPFLAAPFGWGLPCRARLLAIDQRYRTHFDETIVDTVISTRTRKPIAFKMLESWDRITTRSREIRPEVRIGDHATLRLGAELRRETTAGPKGWSETTRTTAGAVTGQTDSLSESVPDARRDVLAGAVSATMPAGPVRIEGGLRYDWIHSVAESTATSWTPAVDATDRRWSYDLGLALNTGAVVPYGRVSSGFRAPNLEERFYRGPVHGGMDVYGDPTLEAERSVTYETGVRAQFGDWLSGRVSAYRTYAEDFIGLEYLLLLYGRPRFQYANIDRVIVDGIEANGLVRVRSMKLGFSMTLPRGRDLSSGEALTDIGRNRVTVDVTSPVGAWMRTGLVSLRGRWNDAREVDPLRQAEFGTVSGPAFWTCSAEFGFTVGGARATLAVRNLFDHLYREPMSFIEEPGRTFSVALRRDFDLPLFERKAAP